MSFPNPDNYARDCDCGPENNAAPVPSDIDNRLTALENIDAGNRLTALENVDQSTFVATWLGGGTPGYRNMNNDVLELINFNTTTINTDTNNYTLELGNSNNSIDGKIKIEKNGTYLINILYNTFDITAGNFYSFYIYTNGTSKSAASSHYSTLYDQAPAIGSGSTGVRMLFSASGLVRVTSAPIWVSLVFRPTAGNPYPTDGTSGSTTQPPRVEIVKVS